MEKKEECKIIHDLLPSYIEKITNEESNNFIERHISNCENCYKTLNHMTENKEQGNINEKKKLIFLRNIKKKLTLLKVIIFIVIIIFIVSIIRKTVILSHLSKLSEKYLNQTNYHKILYAYEQDSYIKNEIFCLNNKKFVQITKIIDGDKQITKMYSDGKTVNIYIENETNKIATLNQKMEITNDIQNYLYTDNILNLTISSIPSSVQSKKYAGKDCYYITNFETPYSWSTDGVYIDKETGLIIRAVTSVETAEGINPAVDYVYEFGNVTEKDFIEPNIEEYEIQK